jgi:hypothetical protein
LASWVRRSRDTAPRAVPNEALQLSAPMGRDLGSGVQGKALHAGTAGTGKRGRLALVTQSRANALDLLASPLPKGDTLLHRGRHSTGEHGRIVGTVHVAGWHKETPSAAWAFPRRSAASKSGSVPAPTALLMMLRVCLLVYTAKRSAPDQSDTSGRYCLPRFWHSHPRALQPGSAPKSAGTVGTWTRYGDNRSPTSCCPRQ